MALNTKDIVKIISKKEEFPDAVVTFIPQQKTLNAQARPTKPENLVFVVHKNDDGSFSFENTANGGFIASDLPARNVFISAGKPADVDTIKWKLFNKAKTGELVPLAHLDNVWLQSVKTGGFFSARSNESWAGGEGRIWTRNQNDQPTSAQSWELFSLQVISSDSSSPKTVEAENASLKQALDNANAEIARLNAQVRQLQEYKAFFELFKKLSAQ